jgi:predicted RNA-binding Zn-ribbon protein involved in translation (DUF1610 family)
MTFLSNDGGTCPADAGHVQRTGSAMSMTMGDLAIGFFPVCPKCGAQLTVETKAKKRTGGLKVTCGACGGKSFMPFYVAPEPEEDGDDERDDGVS